MNTPLLIEDIARVCHEANRAYCIALGDNSLPRWEDAPQWQQDSASMGVQRILQNPILTPEQCHQNWMEFKAGEGWTYGETKDVEKKQHPCMVPFAELPPEFKAKDELFRSIVLALGVDVYYKSYPEARSSFVPRGLVIGITPTPGTDIKEDHAAAREAAAVTAHLATKEEKP